jgi:galactose-1-phosphate uridylyltransferase
VAQAVVEACRVRLMLRNDKKTFPPDFWLFFSIRRNRKNESVIVPIQDHALNILALAYKKKLEVIDVFIEIFFFKLETDAVSYDKYYYDVLIKKF